MADKKLALRRHKFLELCSPNPWMQKAATSTCPIVLPPTSKSNLATNSTPNSKFPLLTSLWAAQQRGSTSSPTFDSPTIQTLPAHF